MKKTFSQLDILTALFFYSSSFHAYLIRLKVGFFDDTYQDFFRILQKHYKSYSKIPSKKVYELELEGADKEETLKVWDQIYKNFENIKLLSHEYIIEHLGNFFKQSYLKQFLLESYEKYESQNYDEIISKISKLNEMIIDNDLGDEYHDDEFIESRYSSENFNNYISTGFPSFDNCFGGWYRKALHIIAGPSNSGKTLWLINFMANMLLNQEQKSLKILYITLEIDSAQIARRLDACLLDEPMSEVGKFKDLKLKEMISQSKDTRGNQAIIKEMSVNSTPSDIEALIRNLQIVKKDEKFELDALFVDYFGLCQPTNFTKNMGLYEKGLALSGEFRSIAQRYNIPVISAAQTNRSSFEDRVGQDKISDSIGIAQNCDMMITINRNDELDEQNQCNLYLAKSRFSKNNQTFLFNVNYDSMRADEIIGGNISENITS